VADLPSPVTVNDLLVRAVYDRLGEQNDLLRELRDRWAAPPPAPAAEPAAGEVELLEPSAPGKTRPAQQPPRKRAGKTAD
jgi:hypothetical protein